MPIAAPKTKFHVPVNNGNTVSSNANKTAYIAENFRTLFHRFDKSSKHIGNAIRQGRITVIIPPVPPATIMVLTVTVRKILVRGSIGMIAFFSKGNPVVSALLYNSRFFKMFLQYGLTK